MAGNGNKGFMLEGLQKQLLIREGETAKVAYFLSVFLLIGAGMAIGRGTADALFLKRLGIEFLPVMYMIQSLMLAVVSLVYTAFADRVLAEKFFRVIFSILTLLVFASWIVMTRSTDSTIYPVYYLIYEIASEILLVHAALYMGQNMTTMQAKRLAPLVYAGSQIGVILGGLLLATAVPVLGAQNMLIVWCTLLVAGVVLIVYWHAQTGPSTHFRPPHRGSRIIRECTSQIRQGIRYSWSSDLLRSGAFALFFMVAAFYILCYSTHRVYTKTFETEAELAAFYGILTAATSSIALLTQIFITNRAIRRYGVRRINLLFPLTTIAALSSLTVSFTLPAALFGSFNKDAIMPAFRNPVRTLFYNVVPAYIQGRARAISVAIVLPSALFACGLLLLLMQRMDSPEYFLLPGIGAALLYLHFNRNMNRAYEGTLIRTLRERLFLPDERLYSELSGAGSEVLDEILQGLNHEDPEVAIAFARVLVSSFPEQAAEHVLARIDAADTATADQLLGVLGDIDLGRQRDSLYALAGRGDAHFQATVIRQLARQQDAGYLDRALALLEHPNPRLRAAGIHYCLHQPAAAALNTDHLVPTWLALIEDEAGACKAAFALVPDLPLVAAQQREQLQATYRASFARLLATDASDARLCTLTGLSHWEGRLPGDVYPALLQALSDDSPEIRTAAAACLHLEGDFSPVPLILRAVSDSHPQVRQAAITSLQAISTDFTASVLALILENAAPLRGQLALLESVVKSGLSKTDCEQLAQTKAEEATRLQDAIATLDAAHDGNPDAGSLMKLVLRERLEQTLQLALLALEPLHEEGTMNIIRAGFASGDQRHIENAIEALDNLEGSGVIKNLSRILSRLHDRSQVPQGSEMKTVRDVVDWCTGHPDEWLQQCAAYFVQQANAGGARV